MLYVSMSRGSTRGLNTERSLATRRGPSWGPEEADSSRTWRVCVVCGVWEEDWR